MLDAAFVRPIAHRGLHDAHRGVIENTAPAFEAAMAGGYGIECDLQPAAGGLPVVFHDERLDRLVAAEGLLAKRDKAQLARLRYKGSDERILTFASFLELVAGRAPLLVEIKSDWHAPKKSFLPQIAQFAQAYKGPIALMSFDPEVMTAIRTLAPKVPRGIVSGLYEGGDWWSDTLDAKRRFALSHLLESGPAAPDFYAYHVAALPTPVTRFVREVLAIPLFTWTVRRRADWTVARRWADAPIFEGPVPPPEPRRDADD